MAKNKKVKKQEVVEIQPLEQLGEIKLREPEKLENIKLSLTLEQHIKIETTNDTPFDLIETELTQNNLGFITKNIGAQTGDMETTVIHQLFFSLATPHK